MSGGTVTDEGRDRKLEVGEMIGLESLGEQPREQAHFIVGQRAVRGDVEAEFRGDPVDSGRHGLLCRLQQFGGLKSGERGYAVSMKKDHYYLVIFVFAGKA